MASGEAADRQTNREAEADNTEHWLQNLDDYDYVQFTVADFFGMARGKVARGKEYIKKLARKGFEMGNGRLLLMFFFGFAE